MGPVGEAGAEPLLGNYFCDSCSPCPSLFPGHRPRPKGQAPHLCFSGAPPSQKGGWAQKRTGQQRVRTGSSPPRRRKLWRWPVVASTPSTPQSGPALPLPLFTAPPGAPAGESGEAGGRGSSSSRRSSPASTHPPPRERGRETASQACRSSSNEGAGAAGQENAGSSPGATWRQPAPGPPSLLQSFCHPLPARESLGSKPCGPSRGHPRAREQKSMDEALARGPHRPGVSMRRGWEGHWPEQSTLLPSQPHSRLLPASASSPQDPQTPTQTWLRKLPHPVGGAAAPTPKKATCKGK